MKGAEKGAGGKEEGRGREGEDRKRKVCLPSGPLPLYLSIISLQSLLPWDNTPRHNGLAIKMTAVKRRI